MRSVPSISRRFEEPKAEADRVLATQQASKGDRGGLIVDDDMLLEWRVEARLLISKVASESSEHYRQFHQIEQQSGMRDNLTVLRHLRAVFNATRDDFEGGYLSRYRTLIQAEVFSRELDQARELLAAGYKSPSAVIAGVVLETAWRGLCGRNGVATGKLERMNADLTKAGSYTLHVQKRITAHADARNNAAHGHHERFSDDDVADMIDYTERFLEQHP